MRCILHIILPYSAQPSLHTYTWVIGRARIMLQGRAIYPLQTHRVQIRHKCCHQPANCNKKREKNSLSYRKNNLSPKQTTIERKVKQIKGSMNRCDMSVECIYNAEKWEVTLKQIQSS